jgi:hypothetical protein
MIIKHRVTLNAWVRKVLRMRTGPVSQQGSRKCSRTEGTVDIERRLALLGKVKRRDQTRVVEKTSENEAEGRIKVERGGLRWLDDENNNVCKMEVEKWR